MGLTLPDGNRATPYEVDIKARMGRNVGEYDVVPPITWSVVSGTIPPGLSLEEQDDSTVAPISAVNRLSGTPTQEGTFTFTLRAEDANGLQGTKDITVTIDPPAPLETTTVCPLTAGTIDTEYDGGFAASGGVPPYTWAQTSGELPDGLTFNSDGTITGTPTESGSFTVGATVTDSENNEDSLSCSLEIDTGGSITVVHQFPLVNCEIFDDSIATTYDGQGIPIDEDDFPGATTAFLYVVAANFNASNAKLVDCVDENGTVVATCSIPATGVSTLTVDEFDSFGSHTYSLKIRAASGGETFNLQLDHASIVIPQTDGGRAKMCFPLIHGASSTGGGAGSAQANNNFAWCEEVRNSTGYSYCGLGGTRDSGIRIFKKTEANFATIESWELEVFARPKSDGTADSAFVALFNKTTGQMVTGTEMQFDDQSSTHNMARAVASFSNAAANFTDGDEFEIRLKTASTHIQLQIAKINLNVYLSPAQKAESHLAVYTDGLGRGSTSSTARRLTRYKHLPTMFRDGTEFFFEGTAKETGGSSHLFLFDAGTSDSGVSGSDVSGSQLDFSTSARERQRSAALTLTDGNRYLYRAASSSGQTITCASAFVIAIVPEES